MLAPATAPRGTWTAEPTAPMQPNMGSRRPWTAWLPTMGTVDDLCGFVSACVPIQFMLMCTLRRVATWSYRGRFDISICVSLACIVLKDVMVNDSGNTAIGLLLYVTIVPSAPSAPCSAPSGIRTGIANLRHVWGWSGGRRDF